MSPAVKYTLGRIGLFLAAFAVLIPFPLDMFVKLLIALLVSFVGSYLLLRRWRDEMADQIEASMRRRRDRQNQLRAALAGDDEPPAGSPAAGTAPEPPATTPATTPGEPAPAPGEPASTGARADRAPSVGNSTGGRPTDPR